MGTATPDACAMGILTLFPVDHCLPAQANEILCGIELGLGFVVLGLLLRDTRRVSSTLQAMLLFYSAQIVCIIIICAISLANADPTIEAKYAVYSLGHVAFAFGLACRTSILARVVYMSSQNRMQASQYMVNFPFVVAAAISIVMLLLWMFTSLYAPPGTPFNEDIHRYGFLVYGTYLLLYAIGLLCMSRYVIKLYVGLHIDNDPSDTRKRKRGAIILWQMTISTVTSMSVAGVMYLVLGVIFGALRNEVAHTTFLLSEVAMVTLLRFVRQSAEIREQHQQIASHLRSERELTRHSLKSSSFGSPRTLERQLKARESQTEPISQYNGAEEAGAGGGEEGERQQIDRVRGISLHAPRSRQPTIKLEKLEEEQRAPQPKQEQQEQQVQQQQPEQPKQEQPEQQQQQQHPAPEIGGVVGPEAV